MSEGKLESTASHDVLREVTQVHGVSPVELTPPLGSVVDPDALDAMFAEDSDTTGQVSFEYAGCLVTVHSDGDIDVSEL